jgi:hypothetical protein
MALKLRNAMLLGALVVGSLDLLDAFVFFGLRGVAPIRIPQSIAAGLLGRAAFQGGLTSAALGVGLHFFNAFLIVTACCLIARMVPPLVRYPAIAAPVYGVAVYCVMNFVVIPLSNAGGKFTFVLPVVANGVLIHIFGVGLPSVLFARAALPNRGSRRP